MFKSRKANKTSSLFYDYYQKVQTKEFVSNIQFLNQFYLIINSKQKIDLFQKLYQKMQMALTKRHEVILAHFVLVWTRNVRFSLTDLVLDLALKPSANVISYDFSQASDDKLANDLLVSFNLFFFGLLEQNLVVEIVPNIIVFFVPQQKKFKIMFNEKLFSNGFKK